MRSRGWAPASLCNNEWACCGASPEGLGYPRALGGVAPLAKAPALAARRAYPSTLGHPGAGALDGLSRSEPMKLLLDTSALVQRYVPEAGHDQVAAALG